MEENDRYVTFREFSAGHNALKDEVNDLRLQNARLAHLPDDVRAMTGKIDMLLQRPAVPPAPPAAQMDGLALALHRVTDAFEKQSGKASSPVAWVMTGASLMALAGFALWMVLQ